MGTILTSRQADELHKSIIAYLSANNMTNAAAAVREDVNLSEGVFDSATAKKYETLLEKKWTGIVRLQKKVMELEARCAALQTELDTALPLSLTKRNTDPASWLPRSPPRHSLESHRGSINCIAFHPVFSSLASGSEDYSIKIWDWELGELEQTLKGHTRAVLGVDYGGPKGGVLLASCSSDSTIKLWDPANGYRNIRTLPGHDHSVSAVRFTSSGDRLISASGDKSLKVWEVSTGYCVRTLQGHTGWVRDVYPSYDDRFIMSASSDQTARLWDVSAVNPESTAKLVLAGHENGINCCALAPPSSYQHLSKMAGQKKPPLASSAAEYLATGSRDKTIKLWDARGTCIKTLIGHDNWLSALVFHPGGKYLLSVADDRTLRCWDLSQEGKCVKVLADFHTQFITCLRWAPGITKEPSEGDGGAGGGQGNEASGTPRKAGAPDVQIRCVIATGSVDMTVKLFAN